MTIQSNLKERKSTWGYLGLLGAAALIAGCESGQESNSATVESDQQALTSQRTATGWLSNWSTSTPPVELSGCTGTAITNTWILVPKSCVPPTLDHTTFRMNRSEMQPSRVVYAPNGADFALLQLPSPVVIYNTTTGYRLPIADDLNVQVGTTLVCTYGVGGPGSARASATVTYVTSDMFQFSITNGAQLPVEQMKSAACSVPMQYGEQLVGLMLGNYRTIGFGYKVTPPSLGNWIITTTF